MDALKRKDQEYIKAISHMNFDIDTLISKMQEQYTTLRTAYGDNLTDIEKAFEAERNQILDANKTEIDELFKAQKDIEKGCADRRADSEREYQEELDKVRNLDANNQAEQKIKLEKEMQILQKAMEDMKAVYKLNEEKLNFNYRVLQEKIRVNEATLKSQKEGERKYKDIKRQVIVRFNAQQKTSQ